MQRWLLLDIGNTQTVAAIARPGASSGDFLRTIRFRTDPSVTADEYRLTIVQLLLTPRGAVTDGLGALPSISRVIVSSVVPALEPAVREAFAETPLLFVTHEAKRDFDLDLPVPSSLGADRLANAAGARVLAPAPYLIVDAGTATTFCVIDARPAYIGGAIAPGLEIGFRALAARAAKLFAVELKAPASSIGNTTETQIQSGVVLAYESLIESMADRLARDAGDSLHDATWFATGGCAHYLRLSARFRLEPRLTLIGLQRYGELNP